MHSLTHILRGSVRFDNNMRLCFVNTINWDMIAKHGAKRHYFGVSLAIVADRLQKYAEIYWYGKEFATRLSNLV